jgi:hypothetical protein
MNSRFLRVVLAAIGLVMLAGVFTAANAGQVLENTVAVEKVVDGSAPPGTVFEIEVSCVSQAVAGPPRIATLDFDANGDPLDTDTVPAQPQENCAVTETVTGGAAVIYACEVVTDAICFQDNVVEFGDVVEGVGTVTVTNTFEPEPDTAPDTEARPSGVVGARPSFTG